MGPRSNKAKLVRNVYKCSACRGRGYFFCMTHEGEEFYETCGGCDGFGTVVVREFPDIPITIRAQPVWYPRKVLPANRYD